MSLPSKIKIVEVGPRDGLQNEKQVIPSAIKIELIERLVKAGLKNIEATSFVSPKAIPQLTDHAEVFAGVRKYSDVHYSVLVPNKQGLEDALKVGVREIAVFGAASETFSQKNIHCSREESLERFAKVMELAKKHDIRVRGYVSCVLGCPYEGKIAPEAVVDFAKKLFDLGCYEISLGDTIGVGTAGAAQKLIRLVAQHIPLAQLAVHFHDTYGQALTNIYAAMQEGIAIVDSSVGGLGGCPYAPGASGNVATEEVVYLANGLGIETGVDLQAVCDTGKFISDFLGRETRSKVGKIFASEK